MKQGFFCEAASPVLIVAAGLATMLASPALGQSSPTPSPPPPPPERMGGSVNEDLNFESDYSAARVAASRAEFLEKPDSQATNYDAARKFATCAVDLNMDRARGLLDQAIGKGDKALTMGKFLNRFQGCVVAQIAMDRDFLRAALAEEILTDTESAVAIPAPGNSEQVTKFIKAVPAPNSKTDDPFTMGQFEAECRVGFAPGQARALLSTSPGSPEEKGALAVWKAVTPQCNGFKAADKPLTPWFERAFAAQALYHWVGLAPDISKN